MITDNNLMNIDPISYSNKDFRSIYEELIVLVNDLTARWDPTSTNESDPGLVLLKLKAFLADKLNYNIDKNTLENFPSQATQRGNAQKLYDILGYNMKYYESATTKVIMRYRPTEDVKVAEGVSIYNIPAFTQLTDASNSINYVTTKEAIIPTISDAKEEQITEIDIIEGIVQSFVINGDDNITVDNLDSDYRLYFNESMIASNGIYIYNTSTPGEYWEVRDNLEATQLGLKVFKFGVLPTTNTCYIEFPQDAATLFGDGIGIKYIITSGVEGNIPSNVLTTIANDIIIDDTNIRNCTLIIQPSSATNGANPESLNEAYRNCKKTINTFNTLVTTQDYANAIFNSKLDSSYVVSNCVVGDRTDDVNYSYKVVNKTTDGERIIPLVEILSTTIDNNGKTHYEYCLNAFDICLYALNNSNSVEDESDYNYTFKTSASTRDGAEDAIEDYKSIQHDYIDTIGYGIDYPKPFIFKNLASLNGKVYTYQKVTTAESKEILKNINTALYQNFNARKVDFGVELNYDKLIDVIEKADDRIKSIVLDYPEYKIARMYSDNHLNYLNKLIYEDDEGNEHIRRNLNSSLELDIIAKSILAGITPYMIFDDTQVLDYTMGPIKDSSSKDIPLKDAIIPSNDYVDSNRGIAAITTETKIKSEGTLRKNENIFCIGPSYVSKAQLSTCLYYKFVTNKHSFAKSKDTEIIEGKNYYKLDGNVYIKVENPTKDDIDSYYEEELPIIPANSYYKMSDGEALYVSESIDENDNLILSGNSKNYWIYYGNDKEQNIICPTMNIKGEYKELLSNSVKGSTKENLGTNNQIEILGENSIQINKDSKTIYAVWNVENLYNQLFENNNYTIDTDEDGKTYYKLNTILQNNDFFIYTDERKQSLVMLGSGTEITVRATDISYINNQFEFYNNKPWSMKKIDISTLSSNGLNSNIEWNQIPTGIELWVAERQIITLGEGTTIKFEGDAKLANPVNLDNTEYWEDITSSLSDSDKSNITNEWDNINNYNKDDKVWSTVDSSTSYYKCKKNINNSTDSLDNNLRIIPKGFEYKYKNENQFTQLPSILGAASSTDVWKVFSRLSLIISPTQGQKLEENQTIKLYQAATKWDEENIVSDYGKYIFDSEAPDKDSSNWDPIEENILNWSNEKTYKINDIVKNEDDYYYISLVNNNNNKNPFNNNNYWKVIPNYDILYLYVPDDYVLHNNKVYKCLSNFELSFTPNQELIEITSPQYITANSIVALTGGELQNSAAMTSDGEFENTLQIYVSGKKDGFKFDNDISSSELKLSISEDSKNGFTQIKIINNNTSNSISGKELKLDLSPRFINTLIPITFTSADSTNTKLTIQGNSAPINNNIKFERLGESIDMEGNGYEINGYQNKYIDYFRFIGDDPNCTKLTLTFIISIYPNSDQTITIYNPLKLLKENDLLDCKYEDDSVRDHIKYISTRHLINENTDRCLFDYGHRVDEELLIKDPLDPEMFFNPNHIFNKYTIPQLNTNNINITIANQSLQSRR